jgi:hypothetical protein
MLNITGILKKWGELGVRALKSDVQKVSATGSTADSIRYEVKSDDDKDTLIIYGRQFFSAIETGRGPRKSDTDSGFKDNILEYMKARGIGADLPEKKRAQLAKFIAYKINKEGDKTFKQGGRVVYTPTLNKLVDELRADLTKNRSQFYISEIRKQLQTKAA